MPPEIITHLTCAALSLALGLVILLMPKGAVAHKVLGRGWAALMLITAVSSFWIKGQGGFVFGFSWIHLLTIWTLISLALAIYFIRKHKVRLHKAFMIGTYLGLVGAGIGAMAPGRIVGSFLFS